MAWRVARSLLTLRDQVNAIWPSRNKSSDGTIGDRAHQATQSDHNPNSANVVTAMDITHDPKVGLDARKLAERLVASRDPRIKYIISNGQILSSKVNPWQWRTYTGANAHRAHVHISVDGNPALYDDARPWALDEKVAVPPQPKPVKYRSLVPGGFFSDTTNANYKPSIRFNNPGAINGNAAWVKAYPGFVKTVVIGGGNPIAVFETPEQGVALWWQLLSNYRSAGAKTVRQVINRYGGGQNYSQYVNFVVRYTNFPPEMEVDLSNDVMLIKLGKAMFRYEAGSETPLLDEQIRYGLNLGRQLSNTRTATTVTTATGGGLAVGGIIGWFSDHPYAAIVVGIVVALMVVAVIYAARKGDGE